MDVRKDIKTTTKDINDQLAKSYVKKNQNV